MDDDFTKEMIIAVIEDSELKNYLKKRCIGYLNRTDSSTEEKKKAKTIIELQDKLRLMAFDLSEIRKELQAVKYRYKTSRATILKVRNELKNMKRNEDFTNINKVIALLKDIGEENDID